MSAYTIRYNRATNHIEGLTERTKGSELNYSQNACGVLTRTTNLAYGERSESLAEIIEYMRKATRKPCKNCLAAAEAALAAEVAAAAEVEAEPVATEDDHARLMTRVADLTARGVLPAAAPADGKCTNRGVKDDRQHKSTCLDCDQWGTVGKNGRLRAHAPVKVEPTPVHRAKLHVSEVTGLRRVSEDAYVFTGLDALRGPVEITLDEQSARWIRACIRDMEWEDDV